MNRYRLPLIAEAPIPSDVEALLPQPISYYYLASDVDARIVELHRIIATLWNDVDPQDYPEISDAVQIELAREL